MSIASLTSCGSGASAVRNPAPHRGFNSKARNVLLDSPSQHGKISRSGSDEEFMKRVSAHRLNRTDSEATCASQRSHTSSHGSAVGRSEFDALDEFDDFNDMPRARRGQAPNNSGGGSVAAALRRTRPLLGDIGKTKSAGDLIKKVVAAGTDSQRANTQRLNILKMPSAESELTGGSSARSRSLADGVASDDDSDDGGRGYRQYRYEMKP